MENKHSEQLNELFGALSQAQAEIEIAIKDSNNPFYNSKYADLPTVWAACRPALVKNNLSIIQSIQSEGNDFFLVTWLGHKSGQYIQSCAKIAKPKPRKGESIDIEWNVQTVGSGITYMRRYALAAMVGVVQDDDDGEIAMNRNKRENPQPTEGVTRQQLDDLFLEYGPGFDKFFSEMMSIKKRDQTKMYQTCIQNPDACLENFNAWKKAGNNNK
jgi:hypothetical protein